MKITKRMRSVVVGGLLAATLSAAVTLGTGSAASAQKKTFCDWLADRVVLAKTDADAQFYLARGEDWGCW